MSLFRRRSDANSRALEKSLEDSYTAMLQASGTPAAEARRTVRDAISICKLRAREEGTIALPQNFGDLLVQQASKGVPQALEIVEKAKREGATERDVAEWWNLNDLQRRMVIWSEEAFRYATFAALAEEGVEGETASQRVRQIFPMYGDPDDTTHASGDDRPLPHELRGRVDRYCAARDAGQIQQQSLEHTTYNAFVRAEIRGGRL